MQKSYYGWGLPADISTNGAGIDRLMWIIHISMIVLFVGWTIFLVYTLIRFRQRPGRKAEYHEKHFKLPTVVEGVIAVFEVVLLAAFSTPIWNNVRTHFPPDDQALHVRVVAQQFAWNVHYPGADGRFGKTDPKLMDSSNPVGLDRGDADAQDDIVTINQLHVPARKPVIVQLSSKDVIHSFTLPVMRVKQDAIPGESIRVWFEATEPGEFEIACAQLCGLGHYRMRGFFVVDTPEKFDEWQKSEAPKVEAVPAPTPAVQAADASAPETESAHT